MLYDPSLILTRIKISQTRYGCPIFVNFGLATKSVSNKILTSVFFLPLQFKEI